MINYLFAFLIGGFICMIGQVLIEYLKFTPGIVTSLFVVVGGLLEVFGLYEKIVKLGGAGGFLPITNFGSLVVSSSYEGIIKDGLLGAFTNIFNKTGAGISVTVISAVIISLLFKPKE